MENTNILTIWDESAFIDIDDIRDEYPDCSDTELERIASDLLYSYLDDERLNLDIDLKNKVVVCMADLGFWNGRRKAWKTLGSNVNDILQHQLNDSYCHWFYNAETQNICGDEAHHDATHHYIYRITTPEVLEQIEEQEILDSYNYLMQNSESVAPLVKPVYGWN